MSEYETILFDVRDAVATITLHRPDVRNAFGAGMGPELTDATVRTDLLGALARATGGKAYRLPLLALPDFPLLDPPVVEVGRSRDRPLWDRWEWLGLLVTALGLEWVLRRRFGYV